MKAKIQAATIALALAATPRPGAAATISAANFMASFGVNTHLPYTDGLYANIPLVISELKYLGITQVRDNGPSGAAPIGNYITLAQAGIHFTFVIDGTTSITDNASILAELGLIDEIAKAVPGSVTAVEGPNEINNWPVTYNGVSGLDGAVALQKDLYTDVYADPNLVGAKVDYFTGYDAGSVPVGPDPYTTAGLANFDNQHPYPGNGSAPAPFIARPSSYPNLSAGDLYTAPGVYTETGYSTNAVAPVVQSKYTLDLYMDAIKDGIAKTYVFDLMDAYAPGSPQGDDGYGLFAYRDSPLVGPTTTPKPVATALQAVATYFTDTGPNAATFVPTNLAYSITGLPATGNSLMVEKSNGTYLLVVWAEPQIWNAATRTVIPAPTESITVSLPKSFALVSVVSALGCCGTANYSNTSVVTAGVSDHPILIMLEP